MRWTGRMALGLVLWLGCSTTVTTTHPGPGPGDDGGSDGAAGDGASGDGASGDGASGDGASGDGASGDGASGDGASGDGSSGDGSSGDGFDEANLEWRAARLTHFTSYPDPGSEECRDFSGCDYAGHFAAFDDQKSEAWVAMHNIAAVHSRDFEAYVFRTLRVRFEGHQVDVVVYDMCLDSDCSDCCTRNASETGFLIDLESYTAERFGVWDASWVEWACLDC